MSAEHDLARAAHEPAPAASQSAEPPGPLREAPLALPLAVGARLLADPHIRGRGNGPVRQAAIQRLQQTAGNRATHRWLQRLPPPAADPAARAGAARPLPVQRITRGSGWGSYWKLGLGLNSTDQALWNRIQTGAETTLPARLNTLAGLATVQGLVTPAAVTTEIATLTQHQQTANARTLDYADAAALDGNLTTWIANADALITRLTTAKQRRDRVAQITQDLAAVLTDLTAAPPQIQTAGLLTARTAAVALRDTLAAAFEPAERDVNRFPGLVNDLRNRLTQAVNGHIGQQFGAEVKRLQQGADDLQRALAEVEVPGTLATGRAVLDSHRKSLVAHAQKSQPTTVAALGKWMQQAQDLRADADQEIKAVEGRALTRGRAVIQQRCQAQLTQYAAQVTPWLPLLPAVQRNALATIHTAYQQHQTAAPGAPLADLVIRHGQLDQLDTRYQQEHAAARLTDLAALNAGNLGAARAAVTDGLVQRALEGMTTPQLQASGNVVLQYLAAHGAALAPLLPHYQPSFAYQAATRLVNTADEFTVLSWFEREQGTMAGKVVQLQNQAITRHGGQNFSVNFDHFIEVHLSRYATAGELAGRTDPTTFFPPAVTTDSFITNQLEAGLNAWPAMAALVAAINNGTNYNERHALNAGGFNFELRVEVKQGFGSLVQCFPLHGAGGAIQLSAQRTRALGNLLALHV